MNNGGTFPELLAPAGNLEKLKIAVLYGANAVYLAGTQFGLRAGTDNFSDVELAEGVQFAHHHHVKVYVTLNAFLHDEELAKIPAYVQFLQACRVDAVILSDVGVIATVQKHSDLSIHLSTQASCLNQYSAMLWKNLGVQRIVLGREVTLAQARAIREKAGIEVEMFVHGAMCMAYSGNCTISNYTLARDSNRGGCAQSCRFSYSIWNSRDHRKSGDGPLQDADFMSSRDLRGMEQLPAFIQSQVTSLKIEGRMKSNLYVATTVGSYAKALQLCFSAQQPSQSLGWLSKELEKIPNRQYTTGSLLQPAGADSIYEAAQKKGILPPVKNNSMYELAGTIVEVKPPHSMTLLVQNPFEAQHTLEILTFDGNAVALPVHGMKNLQRQPLAKAHANMLVVLPFLENVQPLNLARKSLNYGNQTKNQSRC